MVVKKNHFTRLKKNLSKTVEIKFFLYYDVFDNNKGVHKIWTTDYYSATRFAKKIFYFGGE